MSSFTINATLPANTSQGWYSGTGTVIGKSETLTLNFDLTQLKNSISNADYKINSIILYMSNNGSGGGSAKSFNFTLTSNNGNTKTPIGIFKSSGDLWKNDDVPIFLTDTFDSFKSWINGAANHSITSVDPLPTENYYTSGKAKYSRNYIRPTGAKLYIDYTIYSNSSLTLSSSTLNAAKNTNCTIVKSNSSYTHTVNLVFGGKTYNIANKTTGSSVTISSGTLQTIAKEKMQNLQSLQGQIQLQTYSGNELIGTVSQNTSLFVPDSYKPTVSFSSLSSNCGTTNRTNCLRKDIDTLTVSVSSSSFLEATIKNYTLKIGSITYTSVNGSFSLKINTSGSVTLELTATDSRGYTSGKNTKTIYVSNYNAPIVQTFSITRNDGGTGTSASGKYRVNISSNYYNNFNNSALTNNSIRSSSIKNGSTNLVTSLTANVEKSFTSSQTYATDTSYEMILSITDTFGSTTTKTIILPSVSYLIHFRKNVQSMGIGCAAPSTNNQLNIAWETKFTGNGYLYNAPVRNLILPKATWKNDGKNNETYDIVFERPDDTVYEGHIDMINDSFRFYAYHKNTPTTNPLSVLNLDIPNKRLSVGELTLTTALSASYGGTGYTSLQATRNAMGLGNTTGALPIANGGTGATSKEQALINLGTKQIQYNTSTSVNSIPVVNGAVLLIPIS